MISMTSLYIYLSLLRTRLLVIHVSVYLNARMNIRKWHI